MAECTSPESIQIESELKLPKICEHTKDILLIMGNVDVTVSQVE